MPMRNMSKTDSGCGASCAATSPETIAAGVGRDGSYVVTDAPRATGRRSMGTIVQQPPGALPVVAVVPPDLRRCLLRRWCSRRRRPRPPARSPHASLRLGVVDLEARPCPPVPPAPSTPAAPGRWGVAWRVVSKPGQALPPHSGTAAWPRRPRDGLQSGGAWCTCACPGPAAAFRHRGLAPQATRWPSCLCCLRRRWCSGRRRARPPARLGDLTSFGAAPRSPPVPSGPSGALHTGGACGSGVSVLALALPPHSAWGYAESVGGSG